MALPQKYILEHDIQWAYYSGDFLNLALELCTEAKAGYMTMQER